MLGGGHINADMQQFLDNDKKASLNAISRMGLVLLSVTQSLKLTLWLQRGVEVL